MPRSIAQAYSPFRCSSCLFRWKHISSAQKLPGWRHGRTLSSSPEQTTPSFRQQFKKDRKAQKSLKSTIESTIVDRSAWELVVGIEIHAELDTERKLFSNALTTQAHPNINVSLHDLAYPGAQPVFEAATIVPALRAALSLNCQVNRKSGFDRKHYFYQDQPAGYQITQFYEPFAGHGRVLLRTGDGIGADEGDEVSVRIERVQLEQDTAKSLVTGEHATLLDFNRVSHPLIEVISKPDIHSPATAAAYVKKVQTILKAVGAVTAGMEVGGLRADVNVSVRRRPRNGELVPLGKRTEIKNLSSFKAIEDAVKAERDRQINILEGGGRIEGETRGWTLGGSQTHKLRGKEGEIDYRYMPDPDIPPLLISPDLVEQLKKTLPQEPDSIVSQLTSLGLTGKDARTLVHWGDGERLEYFSEVVEIAQQLLGLSTGKAQVAKSANNFIIHEIPALLAKSGDIEWTPSLVPARQLASVIHLLLDGRIHSSGAKDLVADIFSDKDGAREIPALKTAETHGFIREDGSVDHAADVIETIEPIARRIFEANSKMVEDILRKNDTKKINFFVGLIRRELSAQGKGQSMDPREMNEAVYKAFWKIYSQ